MFCSYRISTDKLSRGLSAIAEPLVGIVTLRVHPLSCGSLRDVFFLFIVYSIYLFARKCIDMLPAL